MLCRYDRHREQIIRGSDTYSDESLDVYQYFTVTCYRGYDNGAGAFYAVYRDVFERLAAEDAEFVDSDDSDSAADAPGFGNANSDYETTVGPFYAYWLSYCTKKSYVWLWSHNPNEFRDRRVQRHVEKDSKKVVQKARKERNDEVRALVSFVRKRDRRVIEYRRLLEDRAEQNRAKQQAKRLEQMQRNRAEVEEAMRREKESGNGLFGGDYEKQLRKMEATYASDSGDEMDDEDDDEDEETDSHSDVVNGAVTDEDDNAQNDIVDEKEEYIDHLYCVACNKAFKNESSMQNHQASKKHKDSIEKLRIQMLDEECAHNAAQSDSSAAEATDGRTTELNNSMESTKDMINTPETDSDIAHKDKNLLKPKKQSKKSKRKVQKVITSPPTTEADSDVEPVESAAASEVVENGSDDVPQKPSKKSKRRAMKTTRIADQPPLSKPAALKNAKHSNRKPADSSDGSDDDDAATDRWTKDTPRGGRKAVAKAARKAAAKQQAITEIDETVDINHTCVTCAAVFDSKNRLFAHLKQLNHGVYIEGKGVNPARAAAAAPSTVTTSQSSRTKGRKK